MFDIGQVLLVTVIDTDSEITTFTIPALLSAEGEFVLKASPVSIPFGYVVEYEFPEQGFVEEMSNIIVTVMGYE